MRILHVIPSYEPAWAFGGTVTATSQLCRGLVRQGVDVTVYTTDADGKGGYLDVPLNRRIDLGGVKVWYFHCDLFPKNAFYSRGLTRKLKDTLKEFDLIHMSALWQWIGIDVYKICRQFSKPYIISSHGSFNPWPWNQNKIKKRIYWSLFGKKTVENAAAIHFTTNDEKDNSLYSIPFLSKKKNFIIPNAMMIRQGKNIREELSISKDTFVLLFTGRIHQTKGIHFVIKAMKQIDCKKLLFLIVGHEEDIKYSNYLRRISKVINNKIIWKGSVSSEEIWDYYFSSNLFVLPSYNENFSMVAAEAMSSGLPVLISNNVGLRKDVQLSNSGFVVSQDVGQIANVFKKCIKSPDLLKQLSQNARKFVKERYDMNKVAELMAKAYEDVLMGRKSPELQWK